MEIVQEIGAYAGLAAVVGLAVLSALYFSQARDLKRLREWAGRAPERAVEPAAAPRVVAQPQPQPKPKPEAAKPAAARPAGAKPAPAKAAAAGAGAAAAGAGAAAAGAAAAPGAAARPAAATPAAQGKQAAPATAAAAAAPTQATTSGGTAAPASAPQKSQETPGQGRPTTPAAQPPATTPAAAAGGAGRTAAPPVPGGSGGAPRVPARPGAGRPGPSETAILRPQGDAGGPWYRRLASSPRYALLAIAGVLIVGGGAAFGLSRLGEDEGPRVAGKEPAEERRAGNGAGRRAPVNPRDVTVSVLNGTTVPGLAAQIGDRIESQGFQLGNVTNSTDQQRAESVVMFAPGSEREAAVVSRRLDVPQRERIDPQTQALAGDASVVVIAGGDQTQ